MPLPQFALTADVTSLVEEIMRKLNHIGCRTALILPSDDLKVAYEQFWKLEHKVPAIESNCRLDAYAREQA